MIGSGTFRYLCRPMIEPRLWLAGIMSTILKVNMMDDASPAAMTFGFVIAVTLYVVTYLSFVLLLRYPRNWRPPSLPMACSPAERFVSCRLITEFHSAAKYSERTRWMNASANTRKHSELLKGSR